MNAPPGTPVPAAATPTIGGGIAGIASKVEQQGIKVYKERKKYNEWEFVYDISKDPARTGGAAIPQATTTPPGTPIGASPATPASLGTTTATPTATPPPPPAAPPTQ